MLVEYNPEAKLAIIWTTPEEKKKHNAFLKEQYAALRETGYVPVVFISGDKDLFESTAALLIRQLRLSNSSNFSSSCYTIIDEGKKENERN